VTVIDPTTSLGEIVTRHPALAGRLEGLGLDYCCGGGRSLGDACAERGLDPSAVANELAAGSASSAPEPWASMAPDALVDHIEATHHAWLHDELPRIEALLEKVEGVHGERHPELAFVQASFDELALELDPHLAREERILFPMIRQLCTVDGSGADAAHRTTSRATSDRAAMAGPIRMMLVDHDRAGELLERLRRLTDGYRPPDDACASYEALYAALADLEADTHLHVHKENNVLFPAVLMRATPTSEVGR
jgi:regulator of cell morphogenesis and NO signaling